MAVSFARNRQDPHRLSRPIVLEQTPGCARSPLASYRRRRPEQTALWQLLTIHFAAFVVWLVEATGRGLPAHIEREVRGYLDCGILDDVSLHPPTWRSPPSSPPSSNG